MLAYIYNKSIIRNNELNRRLIKMKSILTFNLVEIFLKSGC